MLDSKIIALENELKKVKTYNWHNKKQNNQLDKETNFIYNIYKFDKLIDKLNELELSENNKDYAIARWYNYISARATERFFSLNSRVKANLNKYDKLVDFTIDNIKFDHKGSVFPLAYKESFDFAKKNKKDLIKWLYLNQSKEGRLHFSNRLFIIFYEENGEHWSLKKELFLIKNSVDKYLETFHKDNLVTLDFDNKNIYSDIIFIEKNLNYSG